MKKKHYRTVGKVLKFNIDIDTTSDTHLHYRLPSWLGWDYESHSSNVHSMQHYVIKFVSDLRQVGAFLQPLWFHPQIKLTAR